MKTSSMILLAGMVAAGAFLLFRGRGVATVAGGAPVGSLASLLGTLELSSGHVLDTQTGTIYDPLTGNYTNIATGQIIYRGGQ